MSLATTVFSPRDSGFAGGLTREPRRNLDHGLVDQHRHRIEIAGVRLQSEPLCLQGQCTAAPANGSWKAGSRSGIEQLRLPEDGRHCQRHVRRQLSRISSRACSSTASLVVFSHCDQLFDDAKQATCAPGPEPPRSETRPGGAAGSSTICAKITARAAASGRLAHHRCSVLGCPCRMDLSRAAGGVDVIERQRNFDQLLSGFSLVLHVVRSPRRKVNRLTATDSMETGGNQPCNNSLNRRKARSRQPAVFTLRASLRKRDAERLFPVRPRMYSIAAFGSAGFASAAAQRFCSSRASRMSGPGPLPAEHVRGRGATY